MFPDLRTHAWEEIPWKVENNFVSVEMVRTDRRDRDGLVGAMQVLSGSVVQLLGPTLSLSDVPFGDLSGTG